MGSEPLHKAMNHLFLFPGKTPGLLKQQWGRRLADPLTGAALSLLAAQFNWRPGMRKYLKGIDGWIDFSIGIRTETGSVARSIRFSDGKAHVFAGIPGNTDVVMTLADDAVLKEITGSTPNEMLNLILKNRMVIDGNLAVLQLFNFLISLVLGNIHQKKLDRMHAADVTARKKDYGPPKPGLSAELLSRRAFRMKGTPGIDPGVRYLDDPYLSCYSLNDFPRLKSFREDHFETFPEVCAERPKLLTDWFRENGFETDAQGKPWVPELRQAGAFRHLMENKKAIIRENDLIAGSTTTRPVGVTVFPDGHGAMIWGELFSSDRRVLNPFRCDPKTADILHHEIFPFWMRRNFREYVRNTFDCPLCQKLDERFVAYFVWKSVGISHTIPNFKLLLEKGTNGIIADIDTRLAENPGESQRDTLAAMKIALKATAVYAGNLSAHVRQIAEKETDPVRRKELERISLTCAKVPAFPAETLDEAVQSIWTAWVALHNENSNTGLSLGRLDQLFQPYFAHDMAQLATAAEREAYIRHAIELCGCLFLRLCDHVPLLPDIGNYLFGGASSTQALTLGGVTPEGKDGVNDMTYIHLKVTEMLGIRDVNVNARFHPGINSDQYLKRLCEVNVITSATPIMQNDVAVLKSLRQHGYPETEIRDWAATGCVEPTLQGRHFGHTGSILLNLVAAMEMALNNGTHPVMRWAVGPETGRIETGDFKSFEDFYGAWSRQQQFIIDQAVELNNLYGEAHQIYRPTPLLSALIDGTIESGRDVVHGGARYNTSGTSNIGLADVTDSLLVIKKLVFDEKKVSFERLKAAIDTNFENDATLLAMIRSRVPLFGSDDPEAAAMGERAAGAVRECWRKHLNYRGGKYTTGFWSMSQHVAYGSLSGPLPSGRLAAKAFTPGLTPSPLASNSFLDNIRAVAAMSPENMDNNLAFNVKLTPSPTDTREETVDRMYAYVKAYFDLGGMQMQFNVVTSEALRDAMAHPENYRDLMVRISGYNAYFVTLNRDIQIELIERTQFGL